MVEQVGGDHYQTASGLQHWDWCAILELDYFQGQITKYVCRWKHKNGIEDLEKARSFLNKYIEVVSRSRRAARDGDMADPAEPTAAYVNQE